MKQLLCLALAFVFALPTLAAAPYPIHVRGADEASFIPSAEGGPIDEDRSYDAIVIGGGLGGLAAAVYLSDEARSVLVLEKEPALGGLAAGGALASGIRYDRGASYWTRAYEEELKILTHIGLADYEKQYEIHEPIDSYFWNGKLYEGVWEETETLEALPASFALFRKELKIVDEKGWIPNQPIEKSGKLELDQYTAREWIRSIPALAASRTEPDAQALYHRFLNDDKVNHGDPMKDVIDFVDLFSRSALGTTTDKVSALAFANFYISEIETRFTSEIGTGAAAENMDRMLREREPLVKISTLSTVTKVKNHLDHVEVWYVLDGKLRRARAAHAVFAAQLKFAPRLIEGFATAEPERAKLMLDIPFTHYSVHAVMVKGHPYRATYDTWTRAADYTEEDFTDLINGRWMDPNIHGYHGMKDFSQSPPDDEGVLTIYQPLTPRWLGAGYTQAAAVEAAEKSVERMLSLFNPLLAEHWGTKIEVKSVETNRWPYSIHIVEPGFFIETAEKLRRPFGRVFFAHSNLGTPAFEEALFRGHCAANNILFRLNPEFEQEAWTNCPLEP